MADPHPTDGPLKIDEILPILNDISIFGGLTNEQLAAVFAVLERTHYAKGEFVFEEGDPPSDIYIVQKGSVELVLEVDGDYLAQTVFPVGHCFGETAVIGIERHTAGAVAKEDTDLIVLPREGLFGLWDTDKELFGMLILNIAREACRRLHNVDEALLHYFDQRH
jgi:CRP/FNR family transcriptional regulator, cyclic AMP receptor protein